MVREKEYPLAQARMPIFLAAAREYEFPEEVGAALSKTLGPDWMAWVLVGINSRESNFGSLLDGDGLGDHGHGHGEMQVDDRAHPVFCASGKWRDLAASLAYVHAAVIVPAFNYLGDYGQFFQTASGEIDYGRLFWAAIAGYNCGPGNVRKALENGEDVDARTTGRNYSADVADRALQLLTVSAGQIPAAPTAPPSVDAEEKYGIDFPMMQRDLVDIFGQPDQHGPFTEGYVVWIDLSEFREHLDHVEGFHTIGGFGFYGNYVMAEAVKGAIRDLCEQGLAGEIKTFDGCHVVRQMKSGGSLSIHSWALAVDFNQATNPFTYGKLVTTWSEAFVKCWTNRGFEWGGAWISCHDAMHFQFCLTRSREQWMAAGSPWVPAIPYQEVT